MFGLWSLGVCEKEYFQFYGSRRLWYVGCWLNNLQNSVDLFDIGQMMHMKLDIDVKIFCLWMEILSPLNIYTFRLLNLMLKDDVDMAWLDIVCDCVTSVIYVSCCKRQ